MIINNYSIRPPTPTPAKPSNFSPGLMQAGRSSLIHKGIKTFTQAPSMTPVHFQRELYTPINDYTIKPNLNRNLDSYLIAKPLVEDKAFKSPSSQLPRIEKVPELQLPNKSKYLQAQPPLLSPPNLNSLQNQLRSNSSSPTEKTSQVLSKRDQSISRPPSQIAQEIKRKVVVLDLDETLVFTSLNNKYPDHVIIRKLPDNSNFCLKVSVRPYVKEFLKILSGLADIYIFTASIKPYADPILDLLDPTNTLFKGRLYRDSCILTKIGYIKDLTLLNKPLKDLILIDNLPCSFSRQPENGLQVSSYFGDKTDSELYKLSKHIARILAFDDLRKADKNFHR